MPKKNLSLLAGVDNYISVPQSSIDPRRLSDDDVKKLVDSVKLYLPKVEGHFAYSIVKKHVDRNLQSFDIVRLKYPLPSIFNLSTKKVILNLNIWSRKDILNIAPQDFYTVLTYSLVNALYTVKPLNPELRDPVMDYVTNVYIKFFAKRYGLIGSYIDELPKFRFLINLHTLVSFFGIPQNRAYIQASNFAKATKESFDIDLDHYDFTNTRQFISSLSDSGVLHGVSIHEFAATIIRYLGVMCLPMFEDGMRFMATVAGSSVPSTTLFPPTLMKYNPLLFSRIIDILEPKMK